ncbi:hypothetical protein Ciccas_013213 [Cichlidogyrus casuarinus]|uniref:Uncharacterized protein n=1 Tax=Cichlidogyrus casuarinus TaxID=1844966 RepID=A0ABD2PR90_9PLAT
MENPELQASQAHPVYFPQSTQISFTEPSQQLQYLGASNYNTEMNSFHLHQDSGFGSMSSLLMTQLNSCNQPNFGLPMDQPQQFPHPVNMKISNGFDQCDGVADKTLEKNVKQES